MERIRIGWSSTDITPSRPVFLAGQLYLRVSRYIHDPITATALALEQGGSTAVIVSMDTVAVPDFLRQAVAERLRGKSELSMDHILLCATHSHTSSRFSVKGNELITSYLGKERLIEPELPGDILWGEEAKSFLTDKIAAVIEAAWANRSEGYIGTASEYAVVGFNRRPVFAAGDAEQTRMYGDCASEMFLRMEGGTDPSVQLLYTWNEQGRLTGTAVNVACPAQVMELHSFISADYWHYTRRSIRDRLGDIFVLPLCGAAGDQTPLDLVRISKNNRKELQEWGKQTGEVFRNLDMTEECEAIGKRITEAVVRGFESARNEKWSDPVFIHHVSDLSLPLRTVSKDMYCQALQVVEEYRARFDADHRMTIEDELVLYQPVGILERYRQQEQSRQITVRTHIMRLGRAAIVTTPFELFVEYGLRIRAQLPADITFQIQLCDGYLGYLPTLAAVRGGSYSSEPASTFVGPDGGNLLVKEVVKESKMLWTGRD